MERFFKSAGDLAAAPASVRPSANRVVVASVAVPVPGVRDGSVTLAGIVNAYMAVYAGRDTTRPQRLAWWVHRLGSMPLVDLSDDVIFAAIEDLTQQRGRYFAGRDADGRPVMRLAQPMPKHRAEAGTQ